MIDKKLRTAGWTAAAALLLLVLGLSACGGGVEAAQQAAQAAEELAARAADAADRERQIEADRAAVEEREQELAELIETLDAREQELTEREAELAARSERLVRRQSELRAQSAAAEAAEGRLAEDRQALEARRADLDREADRLVEAERREHARREPPAVFVEAELEAGKVFEVEFLSTVSSAASRGGETVRTRLAEDLYTRDGVLAAPAGSELTGTVVEAVPLKKVGGQARLVLEFGELTLPSGKTAAVAASFYAENREGKRDAAKIGGAAAGGAILGRIIDDDDRGRGTVLGALLGAAAGTILATGGEEVEIPAGAEVALRLDEPAVVLVPWRSRHQEP